MISFLIACLFSSIDLSMSQVCGIPGVQLGALVGQSETFDCVGPGILKRESSALVRSSDEAYICLLKDLVIAGTD